MSDQLGYDPGNFYVWRVSDTFAIHLSMKAVIELTAQISRGSSENQPAELRGILVGRTIHTPFRATVIEDFKLLTSSQDAGGDPAACADSDDALFEIACRMGDAENGKRALGFFRAQRDGNLNMAPRDQQTFSQLFCENGNIALLIQTPRRGGDSEAALFYWQDGEAQPRDFGFGFPFDAAQLMSGHTGWRFPNPFAYTQSAARPSLKPTVPQRVPAPASSSEERIRWWGLWPTAALAIIGIVALQVATSNSSRTLAAAPPAAETTADSTTHDGETSLGLSVTPHSDELEIRWNPQSTAIAASEKGVLRITDAGTMQVVPFDKNDLRDGYVAYTPSTNDVNIRLEVTRQDGGTTSESIRAVAIP